MPTYKLTYFNNRGRAELIRLTLTVAGQAFEDVRVEFKDWPVVKPTLPLGQVPVLEIDGKKMVQSTAIARSLARTFDLYGSGNSEMTTIDVIIDTIQDSFKAAAKVHFANDEETKVTNKKDFEDNFLPNFLKFMNILMEENGSSNGWLVGSKMTIADLALFNQEEFIRGATSPDQEVEDILKNYPKLLAHRQKIRETKSLSQYLADRPITQL